MSSFWEDGRWDWPMRALDDWAEIEETSGQQLVNRYSPKASSGKAEGWPTQRMLHHAVAEKVLSLSVREPLLVWLLLQRYPRTKTEGGARVHRAGHLAIAKAVMDARELPASAVLMRRLALDEVGILAGDLEELERRVVRKVGKLLAFEAKEEKGRKLEIEGREKADRSDVSEGSARDLRVVGAESVRMRQRRGV